jgi:hypothetical protein
MKSYHSLHNNFASRDSQLIDDEVELGRMAIQHWFKVLYEFFVREALS